MKEVYIYALVDNGETIYVGGTLDPKRRLKNHLRTTLKSYPQKDRVKIQVLEKTTVSLAGAAEKKWSDHYLSNGAVFIKYTQKVYPSSLSKNGRTRISATFKPSVERVAKAYAIVYDISFSEAVEALTWTAGLMWWSRLPKKRRAELMEQAGEITIKP